MLVHFQSGITEKTGGGNNPPHSDSLLETMKRLTTVIVIILQGLGTRVYYWIHIQDNVDTGLESIYS